MDKITAFLEHRLTKDARRTLLLLLVACLVLWLESWLPVAVNQPHLSPVLTTLSMLVVAVVAVHIIRRLVMPQLDLQALIATAASDPRGAGQVALGVLMFMAALTLAVVFLLH